MENERYIQIGFTALRDPITGDYLPSVPMYIKAEDAALSDYEKLESNAEKKLALLMRRYIKECQKVRI